MVSYSICIWKLRKYWLENRGTRCITNRQDHQPYKAAIDTFMSSVWQVTPGADAESNIIQYLKQ